MSDPQRSRMETPSQLDCLMPSPPETDREYAYFHAVGRDDPSEITEALGLQPDECWRVGDAFERRGHTLKRKSSCWRLKSGLEDTQSLDRHVDALLYRLRPHRDALLDIGTRFRTQIVCVSFAYQSFSWALDFEAQKEATSLCIGFWFDTYSFGDFHEEMVELREQLGLRQDV
ncbi:DUF4279 domain-containing protein [Pelagibius litoralis]|uniref:DUF4279 domain-containing protein n=1 Tax=Pelagibius litoralis TaxID=374515 RepID=A0A967CC96_9PROT|nr:DUF4279 domain-containing protein [Pelagibius litoralis]NIA68923.1 DUF4279 domain-containing protein [Pelagibius litoralis]